MPGGQAQPLPVAQRQVPVRAQPLQTQPTVRQAPSRNLPVQKKQTSDADVMKMGIIAIVIVSVVVLGLAGLFILQRASSQTNNVASSNLPKNSTSLNPAPSSPPVQTTRAGSDGGEMSLADLIEAIEPCVVRLDVKGKDGDSIGSGVYVGENKIVTNYHVVQGANSVRVRSSDGKETYSKGFYMADPLKDLAVINVDESELSLSIIDIASELPRKGAPVAAFGSPLGFSFSATEGVVSSVRSGGEIQDVLKEMTGLDVYTLLGYSKETNWIQMTAAISGGNSGGPLVDMYGKLVGINTWTNPQGQNLNFASTKDEVASVLASSNGLERKSFSRLPTRKIVLEFKPKPGNRISSNERGNSQGRNRNSRSGRSSRGSQPAVPEAGGEFTIRVIGSEESAEIEKKKKADKEKQLTEVKGTQTIIPATGERFESSNEENVTSVFATDGPISDLVISGDEKHISVVTRQGTVWMLDAHSGNLLFKIESEHKLIRATQILDSPPMFVTGSDNRFTEESIQFRDRETGKVVKPGLKSMTREGNSLIISNDKRSIAVVNSGISPSLFRLNPSGEYKRVIRAVTRLPNRTTAIAFTSDSHHIITGGKNGEVSAFKFLADNVEKVASGKIHSGTIVALIPSQIAKKFVSASYDGLLKITDHSEDKWKSEVYGAQNSEILAVTWSKDEKYLAVARGNQTIEIFDVATKEIVKTVKTKATCNKIKFYNNLSFIVAGCSDHAVRIYSMTP